MPVILKIAIGLGIFAVLVVVAFAIWRAGLASANERRFKAIQAAGEPSNSRELNAWYEAVDPAENAALVWLDGISKLDPPLEKNKPRPWDRITLPTRGKRLDAAQLKEAEPLLAQNKEALALFRKAAALKKSRYPVDLNQSIYADLSHLTPLKAAGQFLRLESLVHASSNRSGEAAESILAILGAGRSLAQEPVLISQLVRAALCSIAVISTERALNLVPFTETQLASLQAGFAEMETPDIAYRALIGERANSATIMNSPNQITPPVHESEGQENMQGMHDVVSSPVTRLTGFFQRDLGFFLDAMATNIAFSKLPDPEKFKTRTNADAMDLRARRGYYILSSLLLPALSKTFERDADHRARARVAQTAMAVERYRLANQGKLPPKLNALVPKFLSAELVDPFDGETVRYVTKAAGYVVYSVGPDGTDDEGTERPSNNRDSKVPYDITFIMEH
jgi:hypothetical protein